MRAVSKDWDSADAPEKLNHIGVLDGLRAIAVLIVYIGHAEIFSRFPAGFGVTIFFFLSGYLITTLLRIERGRTGNCNLRLFYVRRTLRIMPPLYLALISIGVIVFSGLLDIDVSGPGIVSQIFFFANYWRVSAGAEGLPTPVWSLAVEEHFYLAFPLLYALAGRFYSSRQIAGVCLAICGLVLCIRLTNIIAFDITEANYYWTHTRIDSILFGCVLALWSNPQIKSDSGYSPKHWHFAVALVVICLSFVIPGDLFREGFRYTLQSGALFIVFSYLLCNQGLIKAVLLNPFLQRVGLFSYSIYLIHFAILLLTQQLLPDSSPVIQASIAALLSYAYSALSYHWMEKPLGRLRRTFNSAEAQPKAGAASAATI